MEDKTKTEISHIIYFAVNPDTIDTAYKEVFEYLCRPLKLENGKYLYSLRCSRCDVSHPIYLEVTAYIQRTQQESTLWVPHSWVLLILTVEKGSQGIEVSS